MSSAGATGNPGMAGVLMETSMPTWTVQTPLPASSLLRLTAQFPQGSGGGVDVAYLRDWVD
jgi:hypothetical protein